MDKKLTIAFIGGGNMASALAAGLVGTHCTPDNVFVIDPNEPVLQGWAQKQVAGSVQANDQLSSYRIWVFAVKPQYLKAAVLACQPYLQADTLVISVAAGISAATLSTWLGSPEQPFTRLVRCMPNTPSLIGAGASGLMAMDGVSAADKTQAEALLRSVGDVVWVANDRQIDIVTSLSGSGPAYVFLFIESLINSAVQQGLSPDQAQQLALATLSGATQLAKQSTENIQTLRDQVTSKGGTTAAALAVLQENHFEQIIHLAMTAASERASQLSLEFS